jgi:hypothetical protein
MGGTGGEASGGSTGAEVTGGGKGMTEGIAVALGAWAVVTGGCPVAAVRSPRVRTSTNPTTAAITATANSASPAVRNRLGAPFPFEVLMAYFGAAPSRRAALARWRPDLSRRSRLTSIGSAASASGRSIKLLRAW